MLEEEAFIDLLIRRDDLLEQGQDATPEDLCEDCPELLEDFRRELQALQATDWMFDTGVGENGIARAPRDDAQTGVLEDTLPSSSLTVEQLMQCIVTRGLMTEEELSVVQRDSAEPAGDSRSFARGLVSQNKLTGYQASVLLSEASDPLRLDRYVILDAIDRGGMGLVFKARHQSLDRLVALKTLPPSALDSPDKVRRFQREAKTAAMLEHPNIVATYDACESNGVHFLVMEYLRGQDLDKTVRERGPLPVAMAVDCVIQAARGLAHAHARGIVHRDIKPSNLLLDSNGIVKVLDMGLAHLDATRNRAGSDAEISQTGVMMGTAAYMSPEQAEDAHGADSRSDIYSLGCSLFFLINGHSPYPEDTLVQTVLAHHDDPIPPLGPDRDDVPEELDVVYRRMLQKDPCDRYQSMTEVIEALTTCRPGADLVAASSTTADWNEPAGQVRESTRYRLWAFVAVISLMAMAAALLPVIIRINTAAGTLIVRVNEMGARVAIDGDTLRILGTKDNQPVEVRVGPGEHTLTVTKGGFQTRTEKFSIRSGGRVVVDVKLVLLDAAKIHGKKIESRKGRERPDWKTILPPEVPACAVAPFDAAAARQHQRAWATYLGLPVEWKSSLEIEFVLIPPGEILMGTSQEEQEPFKQAANAINNWSSGWITAEGPPHRVRISRPFYMGRFEVTQAQWSSVMGHNPSSFKRPDGPVENVSWHDVETFLKLSKTGQQNMVSARGFATPITFSLPTEAQWEYACRAGTTTAYFYGNHEDKLDEFAWIQDNSEEATHAVGRRKPNPWGLHDTYGNVWEWCLDWYAADYYAQSSRTDPPGPPVGSARVFRGGCYGYGPWVCRSAFRRGLSPDYRYHSLGFRLAATLVDLPPGKSK